MSWSQSQISAPSSPNSLPNQVNYQKESFFGSSISPAIIFVLVLVAILLFVSGALHLLVRFLSKQRSSASESNSYPPEINGSDAFRRQLQQLFHLHDSGLDQAVIDALPVFLYKDIMGLKEPFDCAVCLCEFSDKDKLRLLPICSHAFHIDCIDTWLLSNSTCPLCRATLYTPGLENPVFDFEFEQPLDDEFTSNSAKPMENDRRISSRRVFSVRLGKFKGSNVGIRAVEGETSSSNLDSRRCFSMGSYQYVVADSDFKVSFCPTRVVNGTKLVKGRGSEGDVEGKKINGRSKGESFSVSKIWQWSKKDKFQPTSETQLDSISSVGVRLP